MEKGWKEVFLTPQEYQAILAKDVLEENGVTVVVINRRDTTYTTFGDFAVYVPEELVEIANDLLKELKG